jgi:hypothetical protein
MTSEQGAISQYWIREIYLGLMKRRPPVAGRVAANVNVAEDDEMEAEYGEETKEPVGSVEG